MTKQECNLILDYFNNALTSEEKVSFEEHLISCEACQAELIELQELTNDLPYLSDPQEPPSGMKTRILSSVFEENDIEPKQTFQTGTSNQKPWKTYGLAAALLLSLLGNFYLLTTSNGEDTTVVQVDKLMNTVQMKPTTEQNFAATASFVNRNGTLTLVIQAENLEKIVGDRVYQVWLIEDGKTYRAGTFVPNETGKGVVSYVVDDFSFEWDTVAITLEPTAESETPLGEVVLASDL